MKTYKELVALSWQSTKEKEEAKRDFIRAKMQYDVGDIKTTELDTLWRNFEATDLKETVIGLNLKRAIFSEKLPSVIDFLNGYAGKLATSDVFAQILEDSLEKIGMAIEILDDDQICLKDDIPVMEPEPGTMRAGFEIRATEDIIKDGVFQKLSKNKTFVLNVPEECVDAENVDSYVETVIRTKEEIERLGIELNEKCLALWEMSLPGKDVYVLNLGQVEKWEGDFKVSKTS